MSTRPVPVEHGTDGANAVARRDQRAAPRTAHRAGANSAATRRIAPEQIALAIGKPVPPQRGDTRVVLGRIDPPETFVRGHLVAVDCPTGAQHRRKDVEAEISRPVRRNEDMIAGSNTTTPALIHWLGASSGLGFSTKRTIRPSGRRSTALCADTSSRQNSAIVAMPPCARW